MEKDKEKLEKCQKQRDEYLAGWQRARADFLNYKKEEMEKITELLKYGNLDLILKILPILDNFEKAEKEISDDKKGEEKFFSSSPSLPERSSVGEEKFFSSSPSLPERSSVGGKVLSGFLQVKTELKDFLKNYGVEEIKTIGEKFDTNFHEAIEEVEKEGMESGIVLEETQKGYLLNGRVIRPAKVKVSK